MAIYHVSPGGTGTGASSTSPSNLGVILPLLRSGDTCLLQDGTYGGPSDMLWPPDGLSGISGAPITVKALNDGLALFDGGYRQAPVHLRNNSWWVLEGFNARHGGRENATLLLGDGAGNCFSSSTGGSNDVIVRRVIVWDSNGQQNTNVILVCGSKRARFEDCAAFGMGRQTLGVYGTCSDTVFRRVWGRFEGSVASFGAGPLKTFQPHYGSSGVINTVCENCLGTWWAGSMPQTYTSWNPFTDTSGSPHTNYETEATPTGPMFSEGNAGEDARTQVYGSLFYLRANDSISSGSNPTQMFSFRRSNNQTLRDVMLFVPSAFTGSGSITGWDLGTWGGTTGNTATNITSVRQGSDGIDSSWTVTNSYSGTTLASVPNPWTTTTGANLCFRYVNGVRTTTPLWPWPMNQRIKDAMVLAGSYSGPCGSVFGKNETNGGANCSGGRLTRSGTADVTADIEALLGTIPSQCRTSSTPPAPAANFAGTPTSGVAPLTVAFTDLSTNTPTAWLWTFGDGGTATSQHPTHVYSAVGTYTVSLRATNAGGATTTTKTGYITVASTPPEPPPAPTADFSGTPRTGTVTFTVTFTDLSTGSPFAWAWNFGDGGSSTSQNPTHDYAVAGTYTVSLTATNENGSNTAVKTAYITASPVNTVTAPVAAFTASPLTGTVPLSVTFTDQSTNTPTSWFWNFGDGTTSTQQSPQHGYSTAGTFTVSLTATNAGGSDTLTKSGYIVVTTPPDPTPPPEPSAPNADFTASPRNGKAPLNVAFSDLSSGGPTSWTWSFGDGATSTSRNPTHTYTLPGRYDVTLRVSNASGANTLVRRGYIKISRGRR